MGLAYTFELDGTPHAVTIDARRPQLVVNIDGHSHTVSEAGSADADEVLLTVDGRSYQVWRTWQGDRIHLRIGGRSFSVNYAEPIAAAQHDGGGDGVLRADMPGVVVSAACEPGQAVTSGDTLMVIESMKMQINIVAPRDAVIESVHVSVNQTFDKGADLITLHAED